MASCLCGVVECDGALCNQNVYELQRGRTENQGLRAQLREWLAANGPGGWIDDLRKQVSLQRSGDA